MGTVNISVYGRSYQVACDPGQEEHLRELGFEIDERVRQLSRLAEGASEHMLLLLASLMMADEIRDVKHELKHLRAEISRLPRQAEPKPDADTQMRLMEMEAAMASTLEEVAQRIERIAEQIEMR